MSKGATKVRGRVGASNWRSGVQRLIATTTDRLFPASYVRDLRTGREWKAWVASLRPESLRDLGDAPEDVKREIFKHHVRRVEIETHPKCNRVCSFCPNSIRDRRKDETLTDSGMLDRVFTQLSAIDYRHQICVARYSEPLAFFDHLCERLSRARELVPNAQLALTTNTDYLTAAKLERLRDSGLDVMYMSLYLKNGETWSPELARRYVDRLVKKVGFSVTQTRLTETSLSCTYEYEGMRITSTCHDWGSYGTDRGGTIVRLKSRRIGPCRDPFDTFVIDYNGSVVPCCNFRSDLPQHEGFVVGDLSREGSSIFDIYGRQLASWRAGLVRPGPTESPCSTCRHRDLPRSLSGPIGADLARRLSRIEKEQ